MLSPRSSLNVWGKSNTCKPPRFRDEGTTDTKTQPYQPNCVFRTFLKGASLLRTYYLTCPVTSPSQRAYCERVCLALKPSMSNPLIIVYRRFNVNRDEIEFKTPATPAAGWGLLSLQSRITSEEWNAEVHMRARAAAASRKSFWWSASRVTLTGSGAGSRAREGPEWSW